MEENTTTAQPRGMLSSAFAKALVKFRADLKSATKDAANPFFKSKYADLASVIEASREPLSKNGLSYYQVVNVDESARVETILVHESGEALSCGVISILPTKRDPQGYGSAITYARRYSLQSALGVATEDDDGNEASRPSGKPNPQHPQQVAPSLKAAEDLSQVSAQDSNMFWYDFTGISLGREQLEFLRRRGCKHDEESNLWYCAKELPKDKEGFRTLSPYDQPNGGAP